MSVNAVDQTTGNTTPLAGNTNNLVGNLSALTTNTKSDAVGAINEVNQTKQNATDNNLQTTDKTIVGGINELRSGLTNIKAGVVEVTAESAAYGYATVNVPYGNTNYSVVLTVDYAANFTDAVLAVTSRTSSDVRVGFYNKTNASLTLSINYVIIPNN